MAWRPMKSLIEGELDLVVIRPLRPVCIEVEHDVGIGIEARHRGLDEPCRAPALGGFRLLAASEGHGRGHRDQTERPDVRLELAVHVASPARLRRLRPRPRDGSYDGITPEDISPPRLRG